MSEDYGLKSGGIYPIHDAEVLVPQKTLGIIMHF